MTLTFNSIVKNSYYDNVRTLNLVSRNLNKTIQSLSMSSKNDSNLSEYLSRINKRVSGSTGRNLHSRNIGSIEKANQLLETIGATNRSSMIANHALSASLTQLKRVNDRFNQKSNSLEESISVVNQIDGILLRKLNRLTNEQYVSGPTGDLYSKSYTLRTHPTNEGKLQETKIIFKENIHEARK